MAELEFDCVVLRRCRQTILKTMGHVRDMTPGMPGGLSFDTGFGKTEVYLAGLGPIVVTTGDFNEMRLGDLSG